jgi:hypothetical protein
MKTAAHAAPHCDGTPAAQVDPPLQQLLFIASELCINSASPAGDMKECFPVS